MSHGAPLPGLLLCLALAAGARGFVAGSDFSLHPPYFNLAAGARIRATATCGQDLEEQPQPRRDLYCKLVGGPAAPSSGHTIQGQFCDYCDSSDPNKAHPVTNAIDGTERWWQSPPLSLGLQYNEVNVTIDLGQPFHVAYLLIKFANSPRPDLWVLERSVNFGRTYTPWQYFAHSKTDCIERFGKQVRQPITRDDDVICTTEYSRIVPLENGEIVVSLVNGRPGAENFMFSPVLREFTEATNIRLRFLRTNTLLGHLISKAQRDPTVTRRYYYSIKDISVGGRCVCHGHADECSSRSAESLYRYQCKCQHGTCGETCERCCPGYNQKLWQPATVDTANECEPCNCHGHATDCYYDPEVDQRRASLNVNGRYEGGGVCINCQHNTAGINCESCAVGYYRPYGVPKEAPHGCIPCSCNPEHSDGCEEGSGHCYCKPNFSGENCNRCAEGYFNFPSCIRIPFYPVTPVPKPVSPSSGGIIGSCKPGFFGPQCQPCQCYGAGVQSSNCDMKTGQCRCRVGFGGLSCEMCGMGYYNYPFCQKCECNPDGVLPEICSQAGKCLCLFRMEGSHCDQCRPGYHSFPTCQECDCDAFGSVNSLCGPRGQCRCHANYAGLTCNQCAPEYYSFPNCLPCQCLPYGSYRRTCDSITGQCDCWPGITGQLCDRCIPGFGTFPNCQGVGVDCDPAGTIHSHSGSCLCLPHVEGPTCSSCKPLYWNLAKEHPEGCLECQCDVTGTLSGIGECQEKDGQCHCKPNVCGESCATCNDGYFALEGRNYFGCQGCQCDVGGSLSPVCGEPSGSCHCRKHIVGRTCNRPEKNYYFPDLHHMKLEIEDGTTPSGRGIRFGYDPLEFPGFSWRGYVQMTPVQNEVKLTLSVEESKLYVFRVILRYINPGTQTLHGRITAYRSRSNSGVTQSKEIVFPFSKEPAFVTVPGNSFADPFSFVPGTWIVNIMAEDIFLDYMVLLPSDYYEAAILQLRVTEPCTYSGRDGDNCLLYQHLPMDRFSCGLATEGSYFSQGGERQQMVLRQPISKHLVMAHISGRQVEFQLLVSIPQVGRYVIVIEYANEDEQAYDVTVTLDHSPRANAEARASLYSCKYRFLCRSIVVDTMNRIVVYELLADVEIHLKASLINILLHKICIIPAEKFSVEYGEPKVYCIATYGRSSNQSASCVSSTTYETPPRALLIDTAKQTQLSEAQRRMQYDPLDRSLFPSDRLTGMLLQAPQNQVTLSRRVPSFGSYVFVIHFYQTEHPMFPVSVLVDGGQPWTGVFNASFCPHVFGCRNPVVADNRIALDLSDLQISVTVRIPHGKSLILDHVLIIPADNYNYDLLQEKPLDKSFDFITNCGSNSFHIDSVTAPEFCKNVVNSLTAFYKDGALPCNCHKTGSHSHTCSPDGGQCPCRPNIIGRRCSQCATGYYGFPYCKSCNCGQRLCDEVTGKCICPPQTVKPKCEVCEKQSFSYHPLVGCEGCNCSGDGVKFPSAECDKDSGQCKCKPRIAGRQCNHCAPGYYDFPGCISCGCDRAGTEQAVCNPQTGSCLCKENVEGSKCNSCHQGSFHLDPSNPKGCTTCFCFGATNQCQSTEKHRMKLVNMRNWHLEAMDKYDIPATFNPNSNSVVADVQELPTFMQNVYWVAPPFYLGDKVSSYGGYLTYQIKSFGLPSEGMTRLEKRPDVQLIGQQMRIVYMDENNPMPDRQYSGRVQLIEGNFRHAVSNNLVSREELMIILSRLEGLRIRALYFTETQRLSLSEVGLEEATSSTSGNIAHNVEICSCPQGYLGDSCQECAPGYYRDNRGLFLGQCVPCNCNGHANRCQDGTGICINCQHNTAGDNCEQCKEGYSGNATQESCRVCPCPLSLLSNSFATGCVGTGRNMQCFCKPGYTGVTCERCAPGYYGNPLKFGSNCKPCNCDKNGEPISCDPLTGECFNEEPKDVGTDEDCDPCDSCVNTLLKDLGMMSDELQLIKTQLRSANYSSHALRQIKYLETQISDLKLQLDRYHATISNQNSKVNELETDLINLKQDINALQKKAEINSKRAQTLHSKATQTNENARNLVLRIEVLIKNIRVLIEEMTGTTSGSSSLPDEILKKMAEAERMIGQMRNLNFNKQRKDAEMEREEAQALLNQVRDELQKTNNQNKDLISSMRNSLSEYNSKLNDLRTVLNEASEQTEEARNINRDNAILFDDIKKRVKDLNKQQEDVSDHLAAAEDTLAQTNSLVEKLTKSKEDYEKLAAQLDGAKQELTEKVKKLSEAARKEPLVVQAEKHAESLQVLANQLDEIKKNTSSDELVRCAMDAATAYEDIVLAVKAAEEAANNAAVAASSALKTVEREDLPGKAMKVKTESFKWLEEAEKAQKRLQDINPALEDIKNRVNDAEEKKNSMEMELINMKRDIDRIQRDDIDNMITNAKNMVANAKSVSNNVLVELNPIKADVEILQGTIGATQSANFNAALKDANDSVKMLTDKLPDLFNKIESINQLTSLGNISENVNRIRELIQQARDAANQVSIPMRFNGSSGVEVRPPSNLEDLKGYTSLSLFLQRPASRLDRRRRQLSSKMFVLYLGNKDTSKDYIGMAIQDDRLVCVYNLGGREAELDVEHLVTQSKTEEAIMDQVIFERIYQYAVLTYTRGATSSKPSTMKYRADVNEKTLLNLDPSSVVFYVGGYPVDFTPPPKLNYPHFEGCIELDDLNENVVSLYNFKRTFNLNTTEVEPCRRHKEESDSNFFEGTGYAQITLEPIHSINLRYEQTIQTTFDNGLLFFAEKEDHFFSLNIENGILVFRHKLDAGPAQEIKSQKPKINDGKDHPIVMRILPRQNVLRIDQPEAAVLANLTIFGFTTYYIGGIPSSIRERFEIDTPPFRGCVRNVKNPSGSAKFGETVGVTKRCSDKWKVVRSAEFAQGGSLGLNSKDFAFPDEFQTGFGFQTLERNGMLMNHRTQSDQLQVYLQDGFVKVTTRDDQLTSSDKYEDGLMHYVSVIKNEDELALLVDDKPVIRSSSPSSSGGSRGAIDLGGTSFKGCITNVFIQRTSQDPQVQNLANHTEKTQVTLGTCTIEQPPLAMLLKEFRSPSPISSVEGAGDLVSVPKGRQFAPLTKIKAQRDSEICAPPSQLKFPEGAYQFGDSPTSYLLYTVTKDSLKDRSYFSVDVRTAVPEGLIFHMVDKNGSSYMALHMSKGRFVFSFGTRGKKIKIRSKEKYNDGQWHTVVFNKDGTNGQLVIDGLKARKGSLASNSTFNTMALIYLGGIPTLKLQNIPKKSFVGCLRNFKLDGKSLDLPNEVFGVTPCFDGPSEAGIYFSNEGGYMVIDDSFVLGSQFEMVLYIRPRSLTGLLIYAGTKQNNYLSVYMDAGTLTASMNSGAGEFSTSVTPYQSLCDGQWHTVAVFRRQNLVQLDVDTERNHAVGPPAPFSTSVRVPLFLGGIPAGMKIPWLPIHNSFVGCLQNMTINEKPVHLHKISGLHGAVGLSRCPVF
uniref:Laminin subunit alpha-3 n=1 Tax=Geotrypetes seraphini TaxID=260995 RepID=A0A6P8Q3X9_GEOSA|nr:laminin subunit alpha-3 [Geotrypetes seraphini]